MCVCWCPSFPSPSHMYLCLHVCCALPAVLHPLYRLCIVLPVVPLQVAKISDFGLAGVLQEGRSHHSTKTLGTISHCAPEVLKHGHVSPAGDVYSFGLMVSRGGHCCGMLCCVLVGTPNPKPKP